MTLPRNSQLDYMKNLKYMKLCDIIMSQTLRFHLASRFVFPMIDQGWSQVVKDLRVEFCLLTQRNAGDDAKRIAMLSDGKIEPVGTR